jgi:hypothetical protein
VPDEQTNPQDDPRYSGQQGYPQQGPPQQGYPAPGTPQQGYPPQSYQPDYVQQAFQPGSYGAPQQGYPVDPYSAPPYSAYPVPQSNNGLAIASLITGICGFICSVIVPFVAIGLGIAGLNESKRTGVGRGMSIAGICLGAGWLVLTAVWIVFVVIFHNRAQL